MDSTRAQNRNDFSKTPSAQALVNTRDEILQEWCSRARQQISGAEELSEPILIDTLPAFLDNLAEALAEEHPRVIATDSSTISQEHGGERARLSRYGPDQLVKEYELLRNTIYSKLLPMVRLSYGDRAVIQKSFDHAIQEALLAFFLVHGHLRDLFVAGISHDLRGPLSSAMLSLELMNSISEDLQDPGSKEALKSLTQKALNNIKRADRMLKDLLDAIKLQVGDRIPLRLSACDLMQIVRDVINELSAAEQARVRVLGAPSSGIWDCHGLRRAIENLLGNAFKYGRADTLVTITVDATAGRTIVHVHNEGDPIPVEEQESLANAFCRGHRARASSKEGWGVGLALVRGIAESHGGSLSLESSLEMGTKFTIDIPNDSTPFQNVPILNS